MNEQFVFDRIRPHTIFNDGDGCWEWVGFSVHNISGNKYPVLSINKIKCLVRKLVLIHIAGVDIPSGMIIKDTCKNQLCINPDHLYLDVRSDKPNYKNRSERPKQDVWGRFWSHVDKKSDNECWNWLASFDGNGYGQFNINRKMHRSHRLAYEYINGKFDVKLEACHKCDNPKCCNPNHIFLGTHEDNMHDMKIKGRQGKIKLHGAQHWMSKLTDDRVINMRQLYYDKIYTQKELSKIFGVGQSVVSKIILRKSWKHVNGV